MKKDANFHNALKEILEIVMFEHWIRFYFIKDEDGKLMIRIPDEVVESVKENHAHMEGLVDLSNNTETDPASSHSIVVSFIAARLDGTKYPVNLPEFILNSKEYKIGNYVLGLWLQMHEKYLDERIMDFAEWVEMYENWREMDEVKEYLVKLNAGADAEAQGMNKTTH